MKSSDLTPQQHAFARLVASGENHSDAYRQAYNVEEKTKDATVYSSASRLYYHPKVHARIQELRSKVDKRVLLSVEDHLEELAELRNTSVETGKMAAAVLAETNRGKVAGHYDGRGEGKITAVFAIPMKAKDSKAWEQKYLPQPPKKGK